MMVGAIIATVRCSILKKQDRVTEKIYTEGSIFSRSVCQQILHLLENIHYLALVMLTNGYMDGIMHNKYIWPLPSVWKAGLIWSLTLSVEKNHLLTSQLPDRKRKIHEHSVDLGEVHLFPDITKWDIGRCCCSLSFGGESKWRLLSWEQIHSGVLKAQTLWPHRGKGEASPSTQTSTPETP